VGSPETRRTKQLFGHQIAARLHHSVQLTVPVQTSFSRCGAKEPCADTDCFRPRKSPYRHAHQRAAGADMTIEMIKTFSLSALFFMAIGVLLATHTTLPF